MNVAKNQIEYLTASDFLLYNGTGDLEYRKNQIQRIDNDAFRHAKRYLVYLKLSVNKITSINGSVMYLSQLRWLDLSHNSIQVKIYAYSFIIFLEFSFRIFLFKALTRHFFSAGSLYLKTHFCIPVGIAVV